MQESAHPSSARQRRNKKRSATCCPFPSTGDYPGLSCLFVRLSYVKTLPISYSEAFTADPMSQMEMDALVGKTIGELREAGYDDSESGTEGDDIVYVMRNGLFEYSYIVDADFDAYEKAQEEWPDGGNDFVIKSVSFHGITSEAIFKRYHTDGSVEEDPDPFEGYAELMTDVQQMIDSVQNGEEVNIDEYFSGLKDK